MSVCIFAIPIALALRAVMGEKGFNEWLDSTTEMIPTNLTNEAQLLTTIKKAHFDADQWGQNYKTHIDEKLWFFWTWQDNCWQAEFDASDDHQKITQFVKEVERSAGRKIFGTLQTAADRAAAATSKGAAAPKPAAKTTATQQTSTAADRQTAATTTKQVANTNTRQTSFTSSRQTPKKSSKHVSKANSWQTAPTAIEHQSKTKSGQRSSTAAEPITRNNSQQRAGTAAEPMAKTSFRSAAVTAASAQTTVTTNPAYQPLKMLPTIYNDRDLLLQTLEKHGATNFKHQDRNIQCQISGFTLNFLQTKEAEPYQLQFSSDSNLQALYQEIRCLNEEYQSSVQEAVYLQVKEQLAQKNLRIEEEEFLEDNSILLTITI